MTTIKRVLTIAGSDSGGGAGIQADIKTISANGCYATSVITAVTAQNTMGVTDIHPIPADSVRKQITAVLSDIGSDAIKIGMLNSEDIVIAVAEELENYYNNLPGNSNASLQQTLNIVLDPVMISTSGRALLAPKSIDALTTRLFPLTRIITPNIPEAEVLLGNQKIKDKESMTEAALILSDRYNTSVLLKAGHIEGEVLIDIFADKETQIVMELPSERINSKNTHGTGCTLSSAVASFLAKGMKPIDAVKEAKHYMTQALLHGMDYTIGHGHGPVNHFFQF